MDNYPIQFRKEILEPFFKHIKAGDSFFVVGAPSAGKTRLMDFLMGDDPDNLRSASGPVDRERVKKHYLGEEVSAKTWLARVDMNRMRTEHDWGFLFYELLLHTLLLASSRLESTEQNELIKSSLASLDSDVIESKDVLRAHRLFEMAVTMLCQSYDIRICFLFDEFDDTYHSMPREIFSQLRAIRDANKYRVTYALFLRKQPERLHDPVDNESFYELISRNMLALGPYSQQDALHVISQLEKRHEHPLSTETREWIYSFSGGHPGFILALFKILRDNPQANLQMSNVELYAKQEAILEEFRKIWIGLLEDEKTGLLEFAHGNQNSIPTATGKLLLAKGLLVKSTTGGSAKVFSPLFAYWLAKQ